VRRGGLDASGSGYGPMTGCCEHGNKPPGSIKGGLAESPLACKEGFCSMELVKEDNVQNNLVMNDASGNSVHSCSVSSWNGHIR